jgi:hypothetical protein
LRLIGDLPAGTPMAFEAAFGWGWLAQLLEDYGFEPHLVHPLRCKAIASARLKNDKVDAATLAQLLRADLLPEAWIAPPEVRQLRALLRHRAGLVRLRTQLQNRIHAVVAGFGYDRSGSYLSEPGRGWLAGLELPAVSREIVTDALTVIDGLAVLTERIDGELRQHAKGRPASQGPDHAARRGPVHRPGHAGRDRRHHPLRQCPQAGQLGRADPDRARLGPDRPARAHFQAGLGLAALGTQPGRADRQALPGILRQLRHHREKAREEGRHHRDLPQAADPRLAPAGHGPGTGRRPVQRRGEHLLAMGGAQRVQLGQLRAQPGVPGRGPP